MVEKLEKGATVTCYKCHGEGHKFYRCPQFFKKMDKGAKKMLNPTIKSSLIYTKPNRKNKTKSNTYVIKKKANDKVVAHKVGKMKEERGWNQPIWVPKEVITNMKGPQMVWVPKCRMDLPGPIASVGTRTDYSVGPWDYPTCAARYLMA
jgi:hypothetical protein